ncbi:DEAD/DEAH box helicase [Hankyongella ginsenosidimutans]|uniref:DEAD-box ATP-dependent RNA helicase RhpA n=1 Tax=Hankyongella ginsenosidimutans TaxID=1763828 RepID=A0A4D7C596_9SPHN|nr:DEAD/DEAH box helicase [Hankyongella ginsenosidimutans]QCI78735.1 DEAD/DEAH box helicase [Hankyongella ginsenosidimutans]
MSFHALGLSEELLNALAEMNYVEPTPIQAQAIPIVLQGRDVLGIAQTGTGKTASFTLPMLDILAQGRARARMPRSLILEPTRELATQVSESFERYGRFQKLTKALIIGGVAFGDQDKLLEKGVDVLIATPGRLIDQFERSKILLSGVEILVIDEADRMLDMGFVPDIERICKLLPPRRQTLFFSATMPPPIKRLADQFLNAPKLIEVSRPATANTSIEQRLYRLSARTKRDRLTDLLRSEPIQNAIIFCNRKRDVSDLHTVLKRNGFIVGRLHGDMEQPERQAELDKFRSGALPILVASDVAARGLDVPSVSHVFNYDVPIHPDDYVHRIGRTGRAGRSGIAITFATPAELEAVQAIEKLLQVQIPLVSDTAEPAADVEHPSTSRRRPARSARSEKPTQPDKPASPKNSSATRTPHRAATTRLPAANSPAVRAIAAARTTTRSRSAGATIFRHF